MAESVVKVSEAAAIELIMSGLAAYEGRRRAGKTYVETCGQLWGLTKPLPGRRRLFYVEHATTGALSKRHPDWVIPHAGEVSVKRAVMERLRPELTLLGEFHTHPYDSLDEVKRNEGWEYSRGEVSDQTAWTAEGGGRDLYWEATSGHPLFLVLTVCELKRVRPHQQRRFYNNILEFGVGNFRFWLHGVVGREVKGQRRLSRNTNSSVLMEPLPLPLITSSGERLESAPE